MRDESGACANCGQRVYRKRSGTWGHCYTVSDRCTDGRRIMVRQDSTVKTVTPRTRRKAQT